MNRLELKKLMEEKGCTNSPQYKELCQLVEVDKVIKENKIREKRRKKELINNAKRD